MKTFYGSSFVQGLAEQLILPFIPLYALYLGATRTMIGLVSSLPNVAGLLSQSFWGSFTETVKNKKALVVIGGIIWALFWIPIALVNNLIQLSILLAVQSTLSAISIPAWTILFIYLSPRYKRGELSGNLSTFEAFGAFIGSLVGGFVLNRFGFTYFIFLMACFFGILSKVIFLALKQPVSVARAKSLPEVLNSAFSFSDLKKNKKMLNLVKAMTFLNFSVAIAGPFFSVYVVERLGGTVMDVAIISAIGVVSSIAFYRSWGTLVDYLGTKTVMLSCIIPISFYPFVYAMSNSLVWVYLYTIVGQMSWAGFNVATFVYLSHALPQEESSSFIGVYNMLTGMSSAVAPFIGGMIADFTGIWFVFMLSTVLRLTSLKFLDSLEEKVGLKPRGIFKLGPEYFGMFYRLEVFISTYSLLLEDMVKKVELKIKRKRFT